MDLRSYCVWLSNKKFEILCATPVLKPCARSCVSVVRHFDIICKWSRYYVNCCSYCSQEKPKPTKHRAGILKGLFHEIYFSRNNFWLYLEAFFLGFEYWLRVLVERCLSPTAKSLLCTAGACGQVRPSIPTPRNPGGRLKPKCKKKKYPEFWYRVFSKCRVFFLKCCDFSNSAGSAGDWPGLRQMAGVYWTPCSYLICMHLCHSNH